MGEVYWALYARNAAESAHPLSHMRSLAGTADLGTADLDTADLGTADLGTPLDGPLGGHLGTPLGGRLGTPHPARFLMRLVGEERLGAPATLAAPEFVEACERWDVSEAAKTPESAEAPEPRQRRAPEEMPAGERREREKTPDARGTAEAEATARTARWYAAGDGWARYRAELAPLLARAAGVDDGLYPTARDLLPQAIADLEAGRLLAPEHALPVYLRSAGAWRK
jgi:hypothetical protein